MLLRNRAIRLSLKDKVRDMLIAPPLITGLSAYNIYYEASFRQVPLGTFTPTFPYIYLLDSYIAPIAERMDTQLPQVVIEIDEYRSMPIELGTRSGRYVTALVHVFGQNRGQRDDLASYLMDYIGSALPIKDYSASNTAGTEVDSAIIDDDRVVQDVYTPRMDVVATGLLFGWTTLTLKFRSKT